MSLHKGRERVEGGDAELFQAFWLLQQEALQTVKSAEKDVDLVNAVNRVWA